MSRTFQVLSIVLLGSSALVAPLQAELSVFSSYTVPGLDYPIQRIDLADVDSDGSAEVLVCDGKRLMLYSPTSAQTLVTCAVDSLIALTPLGECWSYVVGYELLLGDVNRDSLADACFLWSTPCPTATTFPLRYSLAFFDNASSNNPPAVVLSLELESTLGIGMLKAMDIDSDGYDNLLLSVDSSVWWEGYMFAAIDDSYGKTLMFHSFPDSVLGQTAHLFSSVDFANSASGTLALTSVTQHWDDYLGIGPNSQHTCGVTLIDSSLEIRENRYHFIERFCYNIGPGAGYADDLTVRAVGNISSITPSKELLCSYEWHQICDDYDSAGCDLMLFEFVSPDSLADVWHAPTPFNTLTDFLTNDPFPDQFLAFAGDTLMRFDATDGSLLKRYPPLPAGMKFWDYPYGDDEPYLVLVNDRTVSYYTFDEVTDVETEAPASLPSSFTLGQPYPNPFNPSVTVPITLPHKGRLRVEVFNVLGQAMGVLYDGKAGPGNVDVVWDATDFSSGVYFFKVVFDDLPKTVSAILVK
jgi:hypothetical protein